MRTQYCIAAACCARYPDSSCDVIVPKPCPQALRPLCDGCRATPAAGYIAAVLAAVVQWGGLMTNTAVHVVMYLYYFLRTQGINPWWKRYITRFQIVQFATRCAPVATPCIDM